MISELIGRSQNIFESARVYETVVVPVAADYRLFGPAKVANQVYDIQRALFNRGFGLCPDCLYAHGVLVLVTKRRAEDGIQERDLRQALELMKAVCRHEEIRNIAIQPFSDAGLQWYEIKKAMAEILGKELNIAIYRR